MDINAIGSRLSRYIPLLLIALATAARAEPLAGARLVDFDKDVRPILSSACYRCHGPEKQKGGYRLDQREPALRGGDDGVAIIPHHAVDSPLFKFVAGLDPDRRMPPKGDALTPAQVGVLRNWIDQGAAWPAATGSLAVDPRQDHWAFKPLVAPRIHSAPGEQPIDAFSRDKIHEKGLKASPEADRRSLIRRLTFDLTGLPPTPEQVAAFLADDSPAAYEKLVDRLIASPRYGERWARRWMDLVHFAETHGNDQDRERPNAWPYRDYLIRSFNADKPYARFVEEQIAGDVLFPDDPQGTVALGFIAAGPWDESSQMEILDDTVDKRIARNLDRDDMVTATMSTFTSTTVHCARCHGHKFDPIPQADYYALQAVFAGVDRAERAYDSDAAVALRRRTLLTQQQGLETGKYLAGASPLEGASRAGALAWARDVAARRTPWITLEPTQLASANGCTLSKQPDGSILSCGTRPDKDIYTVTAATALAGVTAIRLDLLTDSSLPHTGPGRQDNGNLHLNELRLWAAPASDPSRAQLVELVEAHADFNQSGWSVAMSIDRNDRTAWGIFPQIGQPHVGIYRLKQPIGFAGGTIFTFALEQTHGGGHLIGRFRLSVTNATPPPAPEVELLPPAIVRILATSEKDRSESDLLELTRYYLRGRVDRELAALPTMQKVYAAASDFASTGNFKPAKGPRPVFILRRGEITQPLEPAQPGALSCVEGMDARFHLAHPDDESARRAALAKWLSDPRNVLTWRSIVNRAWQYHFGRGIVSTASDFGHMGAAPSHPELLDWLAIWFLDHGGSIKQLDRLLVTSRTYRQSSQDVPALAESDGDNRYCWRMHRTRLDAESVRDTLLQVTGLLDTTMGGPSAKQFLQSPGVHVTPILNYSGFDPDSPAARRLSVYRFIYRTLPDPFMDALDYPDASQLTAARSSSMSALQALAMMNDRFLVRYCEHLADRLARESPDLTTQLNRTYRLCWSRAPGDDELAAMSAFVKAHGLAAACRVLVNSNEFIFVD